jgi:AraC family transcriptional regulator
MQFVAKAVWFIESHFAGPVGLGDVAAAAGVSRHHLSRKFRLTTGCSLSDYLRGRRLSEAARSLAGGAPDILAVAIEAQYASHEAFTRAFRGLFGRTPEQVRRARDLQTLSIVEPLTMYANATTELSPPRFVQSPPLLIAGLEEHHLIPGATSLPAQWQKLAPHLGHVPGQKGVVAYGVVFGDGQGFRYLTGVEVAGTDDLPDEFSAARLPAQTYAVFTHPGHISTIRNTCAYLHEWLPKSGFEHGGTPSFFERYGEKFDRRTGVGDIEVWMPIKPAA